jgi:hypothetical protein
MKSATMTTTTRMTITMTTENADQQIPGPVRRAKHPALAARILATGLAVSSTLGLTSLYGLAARAATPEPDPIGPDAAIPTTGQPLPLATPPVAAVAPVAASGSATAAPAATVDTTTVAPIVNGATTIASAPTPVVVAVPVPSWTPPQTSGSK